MDLSQLKSIGLTDGEIAVYGALISLGQTSTGKLMKKADISSSKIYLILERLIQKGLVSLIMKEGVRHYQSTEPRTILDYIETKKDELERTKIGMQKLVSCIQDLHKTNVEESAQMFKGFRGIQSSYLNILNELESGEEYRIFAMSGGGILDPKIQTFFIAFHRKRIEKKIKLKILVNSDSVHEYVKNNLPVGLYTLKHHSFTLPVSMAISKHRITSMIFQPENVAYEIVSDAMARNYRDFFEKIWVDAKPCKIVKK